MERSHVGSIHLARHEGESTFETDSSPTEHSSIKDFLAPDHDDAYYTSIVTVTG